MQKLNPDFRDALVAFNACGAEYLVVGAFAMAAHGLPRATGDINFWVRPTMENAERGWQALAEFGMLRDTCSVDDLQRSDMVVQFGQPPGRIDVMTSVSGVEFGQAWSARVRLDVDGVLAWVLAREHLVANKRASGRPKDLVDATTRARAPHPRDDA